MSTIVAAVELVFHASQNNVYPTVSLDAGHQREGQQTGKPK
jgi:hypothetical protein